MARLGSALAAALFVTLALGGGTVAAAPSTQFRVIATLGGPAPGGGTFVNDFEPGGINDRGEVAFLADTSTPGPTGGEGGFISRGGELRQLVRTGDPVPGGHTVGPGIWTPLALNAAGEAAGPVIFPPFIIVPPFTFSLPEGTNSGLYRWSGPNLDISPVVLPGDPAPGGGTFQGVDVFSDLNNRGDIAFEGIVPTDLGIHLPSEPYGGLGGGVYVADRSGTISKLVVPGDPAPGGGTFDEAEFPSIDNGGDVAFEGHRAGEECIEGGQPQAVRIGCFSTVYVRDAATGVVQRIAGQGDPAPGGGVFRFTARPVINDRGEVAFFGRTTTGRGLFLASQVGQLAIARTGDPLPGGGNFVRPEDWALNEVGQVAFSARLDTVNGNGIHDTGVYLWQRGALSLVARTGTVVPGVGEIARIRPGGLGGVQSNDRGDVLFWATLSDGRGVLLVAETR